MSETITCAEFRSIVLAAADELAHQWDEFAARDPQMFPPTMSANDWWLHFSTVAMPERLLREREGVERKTPVEA